MVISLVLLVLFLTSSSVSATDTDNNLTYFDETQDVSTETLTTTVDEDVVADTTSDGTFTDLNTLITDTTKTEFTLEKNYTFTDEDSGFVNGIVINRAIKIDGKGHTIDGKNSARIFQITGNNVILNNISFKNGNSSSNGGAIIWSGSSGLINNSFFINNSASNGGAIYWTGQSRTISETYFENNTAQLSGGAIYLSSGILGLITKCEFNNNSAALQGISSSPTRGGAIFSSISNLTITNSKFNRNLINISFASNFWGAGVYSTGNYLKIYNSTFLNHFSSAEAGALHVGGSYNLVYNCTFINNTACCNAGGVKFDAQHSNLTYCKFINNTASGSSGGSFIHGNYNIIDHCYYEGNKVLGTVYTDGFVSGAASINGKIPIVNNTIFINNNGIQGTLGIESDNSTVENCTFINNAVKYGGGIYTIGNLTLMNSTFKNNTAKASGGALYLNNNILINNSYFIDNTAYENGGAIFIIENIDVITYNVVYNNNKAYINGDDFYELKSIESVLYVSPDGSGDGSFNNPANINYAIEHIATNGTIYFKNGTYSDFTKFDIIKSMKWIGLGNTILDAQGNSYKFYMAADNIIIENIDFINFISITGPSIIHWRGDNGIINNCNFKDNRESSTGVIRWEGFNGTIINSNFTNNTAYVGQGGAIFWNGANGTIINSNFINNTATNTGGAIYWNGVNGTLIDSSFINNYASGHGGALHLTGSSSNFAINNCNFTNNTSEGEGGAIYWTSVNGTLLNSRFINNTANRYGGSITIGRVNVLINGCVFVNNTSLNQFGGAIRSYGENTIIEYCNFTLNSASNGGAITLDNGASNSKITNCKFDKNAASQGGAIFIGLWSGDYSNNITIQYCEFNNNSATGYLGSAIYFCFSHNSKILNCNFTNNTAFSGGTIFLHSRCENITLDMLNFINNTGDYAAAIVMSSKNSIVNNSNFYGNKANSHSGAIYVTSNNGKVINCNFINNTATGGVGGAIRAYSASVNVTIINSKFINNTAIEGGAIYHDGSGQLIENCYFENNSANQGGAVRTGGSSCQILNSIFLNNKVHTDNTERSGGAIYTGTTYMLINNSTFKENIGAKGGAIFTLGQTNITNSLFENNNATNLGGAIFVFSNSVLNANYNAFVGIESCNYNGIFIQETPNLDYNWWGQNTGAKSNYFYYASQVPTTYLKAVLDYNSLSRVNNEYIGIIHTRLVKSDTNEEVLSLIRPVTYTTTSGSVTDADTVSNAYWTGSTKTFTVTATVDNQILTGSFGSDDEEVKYSFIALQALIDLTPEGETLTLQHNYTYDSSVDGELLNGILINKPITINGNYYTINGNNQARIMNITGDDIVIVKIIFKNGISSNGGAIYGSGNFIHILYSIFLNNEANSGGAIFTKGSFTTVDNCVFSNNTGNSEGGALNSNGLNTLILNSKFIDNVCTGWAGSAVFINFDSKNTTIKDCIFSKNTKSSVPVLWRADNGLIEDCNFTENQATYYGSAIRWIGSNGTVNNTIFKNNKNIGFYGLGTIYWVGAYAKILNSKFINNTCINSAAALYLNTLAIIDNCEFIDNSANGTGAVRFGSGNIRNSKFINNKATVGGNGALLVAGESYIDNCIFNENQANTEAGVSYVTGNNTVFNNCVFTNNRAKTNAGAVTAYVGVNNPKLNIKFYNSIFINNSANNMGALNIQFGNSKVINCTFINNTANNYGGAIYCNQNNFTLNYNTFINISSVNNNGVYITNNYNGDYNWYGSNEGPKAEYFNNKDYLPTTYLKAQLEVTMTTIEGKLTPVVITKFIKSDTNETVKELIRPVTYEASTGQIYAGLTNELASFPTIEVSVNPMLLTAIVDNQVLTYDYTQTFICLENQTITQGVESLNLTLKITDNYNNDLTIKEGKLQFIVLNHNKKQTTKNQKPP